jgi:photosystem II stability/assembly factor-like uncharacterized protein
MRGKRLAWMAAAAVGLASSPVLANGRYPNADMLIVDPTDPSHLVLRATFGTLVSNDAGRRWSWICEEAIGYNSLDPALTVLAGGELLHAFLGNITLSAAEGCSFSPVPFAADGRLAVDVTLDPLDPSRAWVLASGLMGRRQASLLDVSASSASPRLVAEDFVPSTIEVARARPERMYVVGFDGTFQSTLLASDDRGQTWTARPISPYGALPMYLSAIDPVNPDVLYVRVDDGLSDHLIVSRDGGQSFADVLTIASDMLGFALSPDGSKVAAGGPGAGLFVASSADLQFNPAAAVGSLRCLTWADAGLFACAQESIDGWTVAASTDDGQSFEPLWHVQDLVPLECDGSTSVGQVCARAWLDVSAQIGAELVPGESSGPNAGGSNGGAPLPASEDSSCSIRVPVMAHGLSVASSGLILGCLALAASRRSLRG